MKSSKEQPATNGQAPSDRFLEAAREAGCEENFDQFDDALRKVATTKPTPVETIKRPKKVRATKIS